MIKILNTTHYAALTLINSRYKPQFKYKYDAKAIDYSVIKKAIKKTTKTIVNQVFNKCLNWYSYNTVWYHSKICYVFLVYKWYKIIWAVNFKWMNYNNESI